MTFIIAHNDRNVIWTILMWTVCFTCDLSVRSNPCPQFVNAINNFAHDQLCLRFLGFYLWDLNEWIRCCFKAAVNPADFLESLKKLTNVCTLNGCNHAFNLTWFNSWLSHIAATLLPNMRCCERLRVKWWFINVMSIKWCTKNVLLISDAFRSGITEKNNLNKKPRTQTIIRPGCWFGCFFVLNMERCTNKYLIFKWNAAGWSGVAACHHCAY